MKYARNALVSRKRLLLSVMKKFIVIVLGLSTSGIQPLYASKTHAQNKNKLIKSKPAYKDFFESNVIVNARDEQFVRSKEEPVQGEEGPVDRETSEPNKQTNQQNAARRLIEAARKKSERTPDEAMSTSAGEVAGEKAPAASLFLPTKNKAPCDHLIQKQSIRCKKNLD